MDKVLSLILISILGYMCIVQQDVMNKFSASEEKRSQDMLEMVELYKSGEVGHGKALDMFILTSLSDIHTRNAKLNSLYQDSLGYFLTILSYLGLLQLLLLFAWLYELKKRKKV